jgi:hypothetical protein
MAGTEEWVERFPARADSLLKRMLPIARLAGNGAEIDVVEL